MSTIDENGVTLDDYTTIKEDLLTTFKENFGDNIKTDDQSVFGLLASIFAEIVSDQNDLIREAINARDPNTATGTHLENVVQFNGISRRVPVYSTVSLSVTANTAGATIPAGALVQDPNDSSVEFATDSETILAPSATGTVSATATEAGTTEAQAASLTKIVNPVYGWASVTNSAAAVAGSAAETYTDLRSRRKMVSRIRGSQSLPGIYRALTNIDEIGRCSVFENNTSITDSYGQIGHSIWAICQAGADADIAEALFLNVSGGIRFHGATTVTYTDPDSSKDYPISFDRVTEKPVKGYLKVRKLSTYPADGDEQIQNALIDYFAGAFVMSDGETNNGFAIGENVEYFRLLTAINSVGGFRIEEFTLAFVGSTFGTIDLPVARTELATIEAGDITIDVY